VALTLRAWWLGGAHGLDTLLHMVQMGNLWTLGGPSAPTVLVAGTIQDRLLTRVMRAIGLERKPYC